MAQERVTNSLVSVEFLPDKTPVISSRDMALHFQKKHKHILEEIKRIQSITPKSFYEPNFRPVTYTDIKGETRPAFLLTRDAFSLLAMGFTGKAAIQWKLRYIEAFNALEALALGEARQLAGQEAAQRAFALGPKSKRQLQHVVRYRRMGLGVPAIGKLMDMDGREVSCLLKVAQSMGRLDIGADKGARS